MKFFIFILSSIIFLNSCIKEIEIQPTTDNTPVVNAIFSPDSIIAIHLSLPTEMNAINKRVINDAVIELYENDSLLFSLICANNDGWYRNYYKPKITKKYTLKFTYNGYKVNSSTTIPKITELTRAEIKLTNRVTDENHPISRIDVHFFDTSLNNNYYELNFFYKNTLIRYHSFNNRRITNAILLNENIWDYVPSSYFFSDELFNGDSANINIDGGSGIDLDGNIIPNINYKVQLESISKEYYLYKKSWARHYFNQQNNEHLEDPLTLIFQGEPQNLYSNIINGYGVFGSFSSSIRIKVLPIQ